MARNTFTTKSVSTVFVVRNIVSSHKTIRIFGQRIGWNRSYDLLTISDISESDIRHSLLKGELKRKADAGEIRVTSSTIDFTQYDHEQRAFLESIGVTDGLGDAGDVSAASQTLWYVDPIGGDDGNVGSSGAPIKTLSELARRWWDQLIDVKTTVHILSDLLATDIARFRFTIGDDGFVLIKGTATTIATGTLTAITERDPASNQPNEVTDSGLSDDWGTLGYVETQLRLTSGTNVGACAWVAKDLGSKAARVSGWCEDNTVDLESLPWSAFSDNCEAAVADDYAVVTLPSLNDVEFELQSSGHSAGAFYGGDVRLVFEDLDINPAGDRLVRISSSGGRYSCNFNRCGLGAVAAGLTSNYVNCCKRTTHGEYNLTEGYIGGLLLTYLIVFPTAFVYLANHVLIQGDLYCQGGYLNITNGVCVMDSGVSNGLEVLHGGTVVLAYQGDLYGDGGTGFGVKVGTGSRVLYTEKPTLTGTGGDAEVGGTAKNWAEIPFVNTTNLAALVS